MDVLKITTPIILLTGLIGNILSFCIFTSKKMRNLPTFKFLAYLSLIDCLHIATGIPHIMSITYGNFDFRNTSNFVCSFHSFLTIYTSHLSSNVLAAIGVFRCAEITSSKSSAPKMSKLNKSSNFKSERKRDKSIVYSTHETKCYQRVFKSIGRVELIMLIIMLVIFVVDFHYLIFMRLTIDLNQYDAENETISYVCYPSYSNNSSFSYFGFYTTIWPWIDLFLYSCLPFTVMMTSTTIIIYKLCSANKNLKQRYKLTEETTNVLKTQNEAKILKEKVENRYVIKAAQRRAKRNNQVYKLLLSLNILFFILVTPIVLCNYFKLLNRKYEIILELVYVLAYLNHCINFVLYGLTCELFRTTLTEKFKSCFRSSSEDQV